MAQQLIDVQTVIKSAALISAVGAIGIPHAWPECGREKRRWREDGGEERRRGAME